VIEKFSYGTYASLPRLEYQIAAILFSQEGGVQKFFPAVFYRRVELTRQHWISPDAGLAFRPHKFRSAIYLQSNLDVDHGEFMASIYMGVFPLDAMAARSTLYAVPGEEYIVSILRAPLKGPRPCSARPDNFNQQG
jgi:hypothetical protein